MNQKIDPAVAQVLAKKDFDIAKVLEQRQLSTTRVRLALGILVRLSMREDGAAARALPAMTIVEVDTELDTIDVLILRMVIADVRYEGPDSNWAKIYMQALNTDDEVWAANNPPPGAEPPIEPLFVLTADGWERTNPTGADRPECYPLGHPWPLGTALRPTFAPPGLRRLFVSVGLPAEGDDGVLPTLLGHLLEQGVKLVVIDDEPPVTVMLELLAEHLGRHEQVEVHASKAASRAGCRPSGTPTRRRFMPPSPSAPTPCSRWEGVSTGSRRGSACASASTCTAQPARAPVPEQLAGRAHPGGPHPGGRGRRHRDARRPRRRRAVGAVDRDGPGGRRRHHRPADEAGAPMNYERHIDTVQKAAAAVPALLATGDYETALQVLTAARDTLAAVIDHADAVARAAATSDELSRRHGAALKALGLGCDD